MYISGKFKLKIGNSLGQNQKKTTFTIFWISSYSKLAWLNFYTTFQFCDHSEKYFYSEIGKEKKACYLRN